MSKLSTHVLLRSVTRKFRLLVLLRRMRTGFARSCQDQDSASSNLFSWRKQGECVSFECFRCAYLVINVSQRQRTGRHRLEEVSGLWRESVFCCRVGGLPKCRFSHVVKGGNNFDAAAGSPRPGQSLGDDEPPTTGADVSKYEMSTTRI